MLELPPALTKQCQELRCSTVYPWGYFKGLLGPTSRASAAMCTRSSASATLPGPGVQTAPAQAPQSQHCNPGSKQHHRCRQGVRELYFFLHLPSYSARETFCSYRDLNRTGIFTYRSYRCFIAKASAGLCHRLRPKVMGRAACQPF